MDKSNKNLRDFTLKILNHRFFGITFFILLPAALIGLIELIQRGSLYNTLAWIYVNKKQFALNYTVLLSVNLFLFSLMGCVYIVSGISTFFMLLLSIVSFYKLKFLGQPLFPWDLLINKEGFNMTGLVIDNKAIFLLVMTFVLMVGIIALRFFLRGVKIRFRYRIFLSLIALPILFVLSYQPAIASGKTIYEKLGIMNIKWRQEQNYERNGTVLAFSMNIKSILIAAPQGYSKDKIASILNTKEIVSNKEAPQDPNVIIIMNEAFWDPTVLKSVSFSEDPIPTFHELQKEHTSGWLLSPQFGGGTANVEFEVLTGHSTSFLPTGSIPYQQYVQKPMASLASYFKDQGYRSIGIHPYEGWFWSRNTVYDLLGFDEFMSIENFENPEYKGTFISDDEVSKRIIQETKASVEPIFIYGVTMQNHGPYDEMRYDVNHIQAKGPLSESSKNILETYTQGAADADASLKLLVEHFQQSEEPTVILFFGDHLPVLGGSFNVYTESQFIRSGETTTWDLEELKKMRSVPFLMWSNYELEKENIPSLSTSFAGPYLLDLIGKEKTPYYEYLFQLSKKLPGFLGGLKVDDQGVLSPQTPEELKQLEADYWQLQYDQMFGKNYVQDKK